jgi:hypothetical protein
MSWRIARAFLLLVATTSLAADPPRYVTLDQAGRLVYHTDARGDRVPDFSHAGYGSGGVPIPDVPARVRVVPVPVDATVRIQAAIDYVSNLPADERGLRGAVLLAKGRHEVAGSLRIATGGVVLRGEGDGPDGSVLVATGTGRRPLVQVEGRGGRQMDAAGPVQVVDDYVPVGSYRLRLDREDILRVGDDVVVTRPSTAEWIAALGMGRFPDGYEGSLNWRPAAMDVHIERVVTAVDGPIVTLDAPLPVALDATLGRATVQRYTWEGRLERSGVEDLRCESAYDARNPRDEEHSWVAVRLDAARDAWVRRVTAAHFAGSAVSVLDGCRSVTVQDCTSLQPISEVGGHRRHSFITSGQSTLFLRCRSEQGRHDFAVGALAPGLNAFVHCSASGALGFSGPIESWATGILYDNVSIDGAGLSLTNREIDGQGTGWASANSVLWQSSASVVTCRRPPGAHNWAIGCWGQFLGDGEWQASNEFVKPQSLYMAQLAERLGPAALAALERQTTSPEDDEIRPLEQLWSGPRPPEAVPGKRLALRNGWLTCDESLLAGWRTGTTWWRGSVLPTRVGEFGVGVTRFVPGRDGPGLTDDLGQLTDELLRKNTVALEHHWGLWYDRRRDDHQMVRRADGDVWPPFYEQPWARSGQGTAWDGLSKYDLEKFNPWYFGRLDEFATHCDRKGLVLVYQAYFQHNVLEAGAHWADFPWRPANCLQPTGFPEPPSYADGKRIFMAREFYDVTHPVRRALHRAYIRHCLDVLGHHPNVVFFNGEEYTGPLEFLQFWLDTVTEWERETGHDVLVGLSATKDAQDAILADPARGPAVSVVELKYWWYFADGTLYAPEGGKDLAPRQQLREWKGPKKRTVEQSAHQVREYRDRHPDKAIMFTDGPDNGWAVLAAGGSLPKLPPGTDRGLLKALLRMRPFGTDPGAEGPWVLAEPGRNYLAYVPAGRPLRIDLSDESASFRLLEIDPKTGKARDDGEVMVGGRVSNLWAKGDGPSVIWLTTDATMGRSPQP